MSIGAKNSNLQFTALEEKYKEEKEKAKALQIEIKQEQQEFIEAHFSRIAKMQSEKMSKIAKKQTIQLKQMPRKKTLRIQDEAKAGSPRCQTAPLPPPPFENQFRHPKQSD